MEGWNIANDSAATIDNFLHHMYTYSLTMYISSVNVEIKSMHLILNASWCEDNKLKDKVSLLYWNHYYKKLLSGLRPHTSITNMIKLF